VYYGARGMTSVELTVYGATRTLHSGHYGNWVPNPAMELAQLLASMKDSSGRVTVAGWYDDVVPLTEAEKAAIRAVPAADRPRRDVTAVMATDPTLLVTPATAVDDVLARPAFLRTGRVVAVDGDGRPVGILSVTDIAREELLSSLLGVDLPAAPRAA
jgi:hypothetical protein